MKRREPWFIIAGERRWKKGTHGDSNLFFLRAPNSDAAAKAGEESKKRDADDSRAC